MSSFKELGLVLLAALAPTFIFAGSIDTDEFKKSGTGVALAGIVLGIYKVWKTNNSRCPQCGLKNKNCKCPD